MANQPMTSRQRMLTAMSGGQPDRVPLYFHLFGFEPPAHMAWTNETERVARWASVGADSILYLGGPGREHPEVTIRSWREDPGGPEKYPLLCREYDTPAGVMRQVIREAGEGFGETMTQSPEVNLFDDYNVPRAVEHAVSSAADIPRLRYLFGDPTNEQVAEFRAHAAEMKRLGDQLGVAVAGWGSNLVDAVVWLCGVEGAVLMAVDEPEAFEELLEVLHAVDKRDCELLAAAGVDVVLRRGWYEGTHFWSPSIFREHFAPRAKELIEMTHQAGALFGWTMSAGIMALLEDFKWLDLDLLLHVDPVQGGADLRRVKRTLGSQVATLGGINSAITLGRGSRDDIRQAVFEAVDILGGDGGFILSPVDCLFPDTPWESVQTVIDAWREVCEYSDAG